MEPRSTIAEIRRQLGRSGVRGAIGNVSWLAAERAVQMAVAMVVGVWAARAMGPERYGLFNYALAFASLFAGIANLGTDSVVVRELVRQPERSQALVATAIRIRAAGAVAVTAVLAAVAVALYRREPLTLALILVFALSTLAKPLDVVDLWFQARTRLAPVVRARMIAFLAGSAARVGVLVTRGGALLPLAIVEPLTAAIGALLFVVAARREGVRVSARGWDRRTAAQLVHESWPLLVAGMGVLVYQRIDQIMIENLAGAGGTHELGLYSAALRLSETTYVIPTAIVTAVFPHIVQSRAEGADVYEARLGTLFSLMTALALALAVVLTLVAGPVVRTLFGPSYAASAPILAVHIWTALFVFWGVVGSAWFVTEGLTRIATVRSLQGAVLNVALNLWLIPRHGALGAAVATLISQACAAWLLHGLDRRTRPLFRMQTRSLRLGRLLG